MKEIDWIWFHLRILHKAGLWDTCKAPNTGSNEKNVVPQTERKRRKSVAKMMSILEK